MSTMHQKMQTDYVWIRSHAAGDVNARQRTHGYSYIYTQAPNYFERLQMIYRSMGKQYDWELEKFRLGKKAPDRGNKKRFIKNVLRMVKNPYGYFYWKTYRRRLDFPKLITLGLTFSFIMAIQKHFAMSHSIARSNGMLLRYGKNVEGTPGQYLGFHNKRPYREQAPISHLLKYDLTADMIIHNQTWKQNIKKELQLLKTYNIDY